MNRRTLLGLPLLALFRPPVRYGYIDVDRWGAEGFRARGARVFLNGRDITDGMWDDYWDKTYHPFACDDGEGWIDMTCGKGRRPGEPWRRIEHRYYGRVEIKG